MENLDLVTGGFLVVGEIAAPSGFLVCPMLNLNHRQIRLKIFPYS
jgi:hypothetical protein